jgi:hypothetical protein
MGTHHGMICSSSRPSDDWRSTPCVRVRGYASPPRVMPVNEGTRNICERTEGKKRPDTATLVPLSRCT